jgi:hypothetical protein
MLPGAGAVGKLRNGVQPEPSGCQRGAATVRGYGERTRGRPGCVRGEGLDPPHLAGGVDDVVKSDIHVSTSTPTWLQLI